MPWQWISAMSSEVKFKFFPKPNMVNPKTQHHQPCVLPPKVSGKPTTLHLLPTLTCWKMSLPIFFPLINTHLSLRHRTLHLQNLHEKTCKHYLCHFFYGSFFWLPLSIPSSRIYETPDVLDTSPYSVWTGEWTDIYSSQYPLSRNRVSLEWYKLYDVDSAVNYYTGGYVQN